jgi:hypothetical protein
MTMPRTGRHAAADATKIKLEKRIERSGMERE